MKARKNLKALMFCFYVIGAAAVSPIYWIISGKNFRESWAEQWKVGIDLLNGRKL